MNQNANGLGIAFVDINGMLFFATGMQGVAQFAFTADVFRDLEFINKELFLTQVATFLEATKIQPSKILVVLSENLLFEKQFVSPITPEQEKDIQLFLENVPFEHAASIIFESNQSKIIATNKDLYQVLIKAYGAAHHPVELIIPAFILQIDINQMLGMTESSLGMFYRKAQSLRQYSFLTDTPLPKESSKTSEKHETTQGGKNTIETKKAGKSKSLFILIGVFVVLLIILGIVAATML